MWASRPPKRGFVGPKEGTAIRTRLVEWFRRELPAAVVTSGVVALATIVALIAGWRPGHGQYRLWHFIAAAGSGSLVVGVWVVLFLRRELARRHRELADLRERLSERLPAQARALLSSPPRTFYFLDHNAVGELHSQIAGKLRLVESREVRKRDKRAEFGFAQGPVSAGGGVGSSAEHENRYASRLELASEFNEVLEHLIVHGQIRFGLDSPQPDGSRIEPQQGPGSTDSSPPKLIDALRAELSQENAPQSGEETEIPRVLRSVMRAFRSYHLASVTTELERAAEVPQYVFLSGRYAVHLAEDYIVLTATYPFWGDLSAASGHPRFCMRVRRDAPSLTSAGRDAFSTDQGGNLTLRCIGKTLSWDGETHTLWVSPIAIF